MAALAVTHLAGQRFIAHRSRLRWWMHQFLFWGCLLAVAITFPLVFGWIHFGTLPDDQLTYVTYLFGFPMGSFRLHTLAAGLLFHGLDISALLVLAGIALSLWRRMTDQGARALQQFGMDFLPIILLFAISVTGVALTVSQEWLRGSAYSFLAILHAITVIAALLFLPFGKFFHIFQRPAQLGVKLYQEAGLNGPAAPGQPAGNFFDPDNLTANPPPDRVLPKESRLSREALIAITNSYFDGITTHDGSIILAHPGCTRLENGNTVTGRPAGGRGRGPAPEAGAAPGAVTDCTSGLATINIQNVAARRYPIADEEAGVALAIAVFLRKPGTPTRRNVFSEWFVIDNNKIRSIYSAMFYPAPEAPVPNWPPFDGNWPLPATFAQPK